MVGLRWSGGLSSLRSIAGIYLLEGAGKKPGLGRHGASWGWWCAVEYGGQEHTTRRPTSGVDAHTVIWNVENIQGRPRTLINSLGLEEASRRSSVDKT